MSITEIQRVNSTSYIDVVGLQLGLPRLPGEDTATYAQRLSHAANSRRDHPYEGALNEIALQLGLEVKPYMTITSTDPNAVLVCSPAGISLVATGETVNCDLVALDGDDVWNWKKLSDVVAQINASTHFHATLLVNDGLTLQLSRQTNRLYSVAESVTDIKMQLLHSGIQVGTEKFNQKVGSYSLTAGGALSMSDEPAPGLAITYEYRVWPYDVVGSQVGLIGLTDPDFPAIAARSNSVLAYQVREALQTIMEEDRSYWAK